MPRTGNTARPKHAGESPTASSATPSPARKRAPRRKPAVVADAAEVAGVETAVATVATVAEAAAEPVVAPLEAVTAPVEAAVALAPAAVAEAREAPRQFLTFLLDEQEYGIEIRSVQEIRGYTRLTTLPNTPPHLKGLLDVRGTVIPVFDMRVWFGKEAIPCTPLSVIVTVTVGDRVVGLLVDGVSDVREVPPGGLVQPPDMGFAVRTSHLEGLAAVGDRLLTVLRLDEVVRGMMAA